VLSKLYLFTTEFKKWDKVVFLDADIIVRASLDELLKIKGFAAFQEGPLSRRFAKTETTELLFKELTRRYNIKRPGIAGGILVFSTDIIKEETFSELYGLLKKYEEIIWHEESILGLYFYKKWIKIPDMYNVCVNYAILPKTRPEKVKGIVLHFVGQDPTGKPWYPENKFYNEWKNNLEKVELIDLNKRSPGKILSDKEIKRHTLLLRIKRYYTCFIAEIDRNIGLVGIFLKKNFPKLYFKLKRIKGD
jgi:lipopolysaccharide biosynthesis glycosyltransferase